MAKRLLLTVTLYLFCFLGTALAQSNQIFIKSKPAAEGGYGKATKWAGLDSDNLPRKMRVLMQSGAVLSIEPAFKVNLPDSLPESSLLNRWAIITVDSNSNASELIALLQKDAKFEVVEPAPQHKQHLTVPPNDPYYAMPPSSPNTWFLFSTAASVAWGSHTGTNEVVLAVVDDGVRTTHEDLSPNLWVNPYEIPGNGIDDDLNGFVDDINGWDAANNDNEPNPWPDLYSHGTHVAGCAVARTNNGVGIASVSYNTAKLMAVKVKNSGEIANLSLDAATAGLNYVVQTYLAHLVQGADYRLVANLSFGSASYSAFEQDLVNFGANLGIVWVASAGNDNLEAKSYPAAYDNVICVAASDQVDKKASFSNFGSWVDITTPGVAIHSCDVNGNNLYVNKQGTSMSAPITAGALALLLAQNNTLSPAQVEKCLVESADGIDILNPAYAGKLGGGRLNVANLIQCNPTGMPLVDMAVSDITMSPLDPATCAPNVQAAVTLTNVGEATITNYNVTYRWNAEAPVTLGLSSAGIVQGASALLLLPAKTLAAGSNTLTVWVHSPNGTTDFVSSNDTLSDEIMLNNTPYDLGATLFNENFESGSLLTNFWEVDNPDSANTFGIKTTVGNPSGGVYSAGIDIFNNSFFGSKTDALISRVFAVPATTDKTTSLSFRHAYKNYNNATDGLRVLVSENCGLSYNKVVYYGAPRNYVGVDDFASAPNSSSDFVPTSNTEWSSTATNNNYAVMVSKINLDDYRGKNIRLKFEVINGRSQAENITSGNNMYLDDITIVSANYNPACRADGDTLSQFTGTVIGTQFSGTHPGTSFYTDGGNNIFFHYGHTDQTFLARAERFDNQFKYNQVLGAVFEFQNTGAPTPAPNDKVIATVWAADGINGGPGTVLASKDLMLTDIYQDISKAQPTKVEFASPVDFKGVFYVGIRFVYPTTGRVGLLGNAEADCFQPGASWVNHAADGWLTARHHTGKMNHRIFPIVTHSDATLNTPTNLTGPRTPCAGTVVTYSVDDLGHTYNWKLPTGWAIASGAGTATIEVIPDAVAGIISVTADDGSCVSNPDTFAVAPLPAPPQPSAIANLTGGAMCEGSQKDFAVTPVGGVSYVWTLPSGWGGNSTTNTITATLGPTGDVEVYAQLPNGCISPSQTLNVSTTAGASLGTLGAIIGSAVPCQGSATSYSVPALAGAVSYNWSVPLGWTINSGQGTTTINATPSNYTGTITVVASNGSGTCPSTAASTLAVNTVPQPVGVSGYTMVCQGQSYTYTTPNVANATTYNWSLPTGWSINAGSGTNTITVTAGASTGNVTVTAGTGACNTDQASLAVNTVITQPGAITGSTNVCPNTIQTYSVAPVPGADSYTWILPTDWLGSSTSNTITVATSETAGNIEVTANLGGCAGPAQTLAVAVKPQPDPISGLMFANRCPGGGQKMGPSAVTSPSGGTITWGLPSGWSIDGGPNDYPDVTIGSAGGNITAYTTVDGCVSPTVSWSTNVQTPITPAAISGPSPVCGGAPVTYEAGAVPGALGYEWEFPATWSPNTAATTSQFVTVVPSGAGGTVRVRASNGVCWSNWQTRTINFGGSAATTPSVSGATGICAFRKGIMFTASSTDPVNGWEWQLESDLLAAGWAFESSTNNDTVYVTVGNRAANSTTGRRFRVRAISGGCYSPYRRIDVNIKGVNPTVLGNVQWNNGGSWEDADGATIGCPGDVVDLRINASPATVGGGSVTWDWELPAGWNITSGYKTKTITVSTNENIGPVYGWARNTQCAAPLGRSDSSKATPQFDLYPSPVGSISGSDRVCASTAYTYSIDPVPNATGYNWSFPAGWTVNSGAGTNTINVTTDATPTDGTVSVEPTSAGCSATPATQAVKALVIAGGASGPNYNLTVNTETFNYLSGGTLVTGMGPNSTDVTSALTAMPLPFKLGGNTVSNIAISSNGSIWFSENLTDYNTVTSNFLYSFTVMAESWDGEPLYSDVDNHILDLPEMNAVISALATGMRTSSETGSGVRTKIEGTAPSRYYVIEWRGMDIDADYAFGTGSNINRESVSVQLRLYEDAHPTKANHIEMLYKQEADAPLCSYSGFSFFPPHTFDIGLANANGYCILNGTGGSATLQKGGTGDMNNGAGGPLTTAQCSDGLPATNTKFVLEPVVVLPGGPPLNNECANAIGLSLENNGGCALIDLPPYNTENATATGAPANPACFSGSKTNEVWFSLNKPFGVNNVKISADFNMSCTPSSTAGTAMEVFTGTCASLTSIACADNNGVLNPRDAIVTLNGLPDDITNYYIRVKNDDAETDVFTVCAENASPPGCDAPAASLTSNDAPYSSPFSLVDCGAATNLFSAFPKPPCITTSNWENTNIGQTVVKFTTLTDDETYQIQVAKSLCCGFPPSNWNNRLYEFYVLKQCPSDPGYQPASACLGFTATNGGGGTSGAIGPGIDVNFPTAGDYYIVIARTAEGCTGATTPQLFINRKYRSVPSSCSNPVVVPSLPYTATYTTCGAGDNHRGSGSIPNSSYPDLVEYTNGWSNAEEMVFRYLNTEVDPIYVDVDLLRKGTNTMLLTVFGPFDSPTCPGSTTIAPDSCIYHGYAGNSNLQNGGYQIKLNGSGYYYFYVQANHSASPTCAGFEINISKAHNYYKNLPDFVYTADTTSLGDTLTTGLLSTCGMTDKYNSVNGTFYGGLSNCGGLNHSPNGDNWIRPSCAWLPSTKSQDIREAWFTFTPKVSRQYKVRFGSNTMDGMLAVFDDVPLQENNPILLATGAANNGDNTWDAPIQMEAGFTYHFLYSTNNASTKCGDVEVILEDAGDPFLGNTCGSPIPITNLTGGPFTEHNVTSTHNGEFYEADPDNPGGCFYHPYGNNELSAMAHAPEVGTERVYRYVAEKDGCVRITLQRQGTLYQDLDANVFKYYGFSISKGCVDQAGSTCEGAYAVVGTSMEVEGSFTAIQGEEYYIYMHSDTTTTGDLAGAQNRVNLTVEFCDQEAPANDFPCTAQLVTSGQTVLGSSQGAGPDGYEHSSCQVVDGKSYYWPTTIKDTNRWAKQNSVWYKFVAPSDYIRLEGQSENYDAFKDRNTKYTFSIYKGGDCNNLTELTGSCDNTARPNMCYKHPTDGYNRYMFVGKDFTGGFNKGETLYLRVDANGNNQGYFSFRILDMYKLNCVEDIQDMATAKYVYKSPIDVTGGVMGMGQDCDFPYWWSGWGSSNLTETSDYALMQESASLDNLEKSPVWLKFQINSAPGATPLRFTIKTESTYPNNFNWALFEANADGTPNRKLWAGGTANDVPNVRMPAEAAVRASGAWYYLVEKEAPIAPSENWGGLGNENNDNPAAAPWNDATRDLVDFGIWNSTAAITHTAPGPNNGLQSHTVNPTGLQEWQNGNNYAQPLDVSGKADAWYYLLIDFKNGNGTENFEIDFHDSPLKYSCGPQPATLQWVGSMSSNWFEPTNWVDPSDITKRGCWIPDANTHVVISTNSPICAGDPPFWPQVGDSANFGLAHAANITVESGAEMYLTDGAVIHTTGQVSIHNSAGTYFWGAPSSVVAFTGTLNQTVSFGSNTTQAVFGGFDVRNNSGTVDVLGPQLVLDGSLKIRSGATFDAAGLDIWVGGDLTNMGTLLNPATNLTFNGLGVDQVYYSPQLINWGNVIVNKASHPASPNVPDTLRVLSNLLIDYDGAGGVNNYLDLTRGIVVVPSASHNIYVRNNGAANAIRNYNPNSYVIGRLRRDVTSNFRTYAFPVGLANNGYQLAEIIFGARGSVATLEATALPYQPLLSANGVKNECPSANFLDNYLDNGFWQIDAFDAGGAQVTNQGLYDLTVYPTNYTNAGAYQTITRNHLTDGNPFGTCGGLPTVRRLGLSGFSTFRVGQGSFVPPVALPVEMLSLAATPNGNYINLNWTTATELNNRGFYVQRSTDGQNYHTIGFVAGAGNANSRQTYSYPDYKAVNGQLYYYRLQQTNFDGSNQLTRVVTARLEPLYKFEAKVYPNPTNNVFNVDIETGLNNTVRITLFDLMGRVAKTLTTTLVNGNTTLTLSVAGLANGQYIMRIQHNHGIETRKVIKN